MDETSKNSGWKMYRAGGGEINLLTSKFIAKWILLLFITLHGSLLQSSTSTLNGSGFFELQERTSTANAHLDEINNNATTPKLLNILIVTLS